MEHGTSRHGVERVARPPLHGAFPTKRGAMPKVYGASNPFPWMSEILDLKKEKNFFETRVTESQTGGALTWD